MYFPKSSSPQSEPLLQSDSKYGRSLDYDPTFKGMTKERRSCNDIVFGILFILMVLAMGVISFVAYSQGQPEKLIPSNEFVQEGEDRGKYWFQDAVAHMKNDYDIMLGALGFSIVLAVVWILLLRAFTKLFIYLTLVFGILLVLAAAMYTLSVGWAKKSFGLQVTSYCIFGIAALLFLAILFFRKKINLTAALMTETCKGISYNPGIFLVASIICVAFVGFTIEWVSSFVYLYSIPDDSAVQPTGLEFPEITPKFKENVRNLMVFQVFGYLWVAAFISGVFQVSIAGAISTWYFSRDVRGYQGPSSPSMSAFGYALTKSFGSIAFGSLVIAIVEFINWALRCSKKANKGNKVVAAIICLIQCLFACVQRLVKFINRFAYVYIAMHGTAFCTSARNCFDLVGRNIVSAVVIDFLGSFVLFVGKLLGTAACLTLSILLLHGLDRAVSGVTLIIVALTSFIIFHLFSLIIGVGVDTVFVCYLEDIERNKDGNLYMDPEVHRMIQEKVHDSKEINSDN